MYKILINTESNHLKDDTEHSLEFRICKGDYYLTCHGIDIVDLATEEVVLRKYTLAEIFVSITR